MQNFKNELKKMFGLAGSLVIVYLAIRYWEKLEGFVKLAFQAATPLIIGCIMAYVINILMGFFEKQYDKLVKVDVSSKIKRSVSLILAFLSLIGIVSLIINLVLPELINCIASFIRLIPGALQMVIDFVGEEQILKLYPELSNGFDITAVSAEVEGLIKTIAGGVGGAVESIMMLISSVTSFVVNLLIGLIFSLYVLLEKEKLGSQLKCIIKIYFPKVADKVFYLTKVLDESFHNFIVGQCIEAVVLGGLCTVGMLILQFPYAVMIGVFIGFTALIPIAGAYIGAGVGAVMILTVSPVRALEFLVFILILQQLEGNLIYPKIVGKSIGLPGIWVLTAITIGGGVLGVGGMLLAVPLFAAGYRLLKEDIERRNPIITSANSLVVVARIYTEFSEKFGIPRQSGLVPSLRGEIVFEPEFRSMEAIRGLEEFSHIWLLWEFSKAKKDKVSLVVTPPRLGGKEKKGVFATRAPYRPNSIGLSSVKLEEIYMDEKRGPVLVVSGADILNDTPIYDIKPYLAYTDSHPEAKGSFGELHKDDQIEVRVSEELLEKIPVELQERVLAVLKQDPRAAYNKKPDYVYGMSFSGYDVRFIIEENVLIVKDVVKENDTEYKKVK